MRNGRRTRQPGILRLTVRTSFGRHPDPARDLPSMFPRSDTHLPSRVRPAVQICLRLRQAKSSPMTPPLSAAIENTKRHPPSDRRPRRSDASMSSAAPENERSAPLQIARTRSESPSPLPERPAAIHTPGAPGASTIRSARPASPALAVTSLRFKVRRGTADRARERNHAQSSGGPAMTCDVPWTSSLPIASRAGTRSRQLQ